MFIEKIDQNFIKINFYPNDEDIYIGDIFKVISPDKKGVLVQTTSIERSELDKRCNVARSKVLFTIEKTGELSPWQGNIPGNDFVVNKADPAEILSVTNTGNVPNPVLSGQLSCCKETVVNIEASFLEKPSVIIADKETQKNSLLSLLAKNLSEKEADVVFVNFDGDFSADCEATILKAGKDVKLPFDLIGLENLYDKILSSLSGEIRANIENIFLEIEDYLASGEISFLPFKIFVDSVNAENQANKIPELDLLTNNLFKLHKRGVFAENQREIVNLFASLSNNNLVVLDLSQIDKEWKPFFVDFIFSFNKEKMKKNFFLLMDIDKYSAYNDLDSAEIGQKVFNHGLKSGIKPIISINHDSNLMKTTLAQAENLFIFAPVEDSKISGLKPYITRLNQTEALISGKITNNIPLYVNLCAVDSETGVFFNSQSLAKQAGVDVNRCFEEEPYSSEVFQPNEFEKNPQYEEFSQENSYLDKEENEGAIENQSYSVDYGNDEFNAYQESSNMQEEEDEDFTSESKTPYQRAMEMLDDDPVEESAEEDVSEESYYRPDEDNNLDYAENTEYEEDEVSYYQSQEEFQDESVLDYIAGEIDENDENDVDQETNLQENVNTEFSDYDLNKFMDLDDDPVEESAEKDVSEESYYRPDEDNNLDYAENTEYEEDEVSYYQSQEEFQDESVLDYVAGEDDEEAQEEYISQPQSSYNVNSQEFSDDDINNFVDLDDDEPQMAETETVVEPKASAKKEKLPPPSTSALPVYNVSENGENDYSELDLKEGDAVKHDKYGVGVVKKVIGYSEKKLCSIQFEDIGRRLLDPKLAGLEKIN